MDLISWVFSKPPADTRSPLVIDAADITRSLTYDDLRSQVRQLVAGLQAHGVRPGDCVCVNSFNDIHYIVLYLGIIGAGAIFTGVNPSYTKSELVHHFRLCKPTLVIAEPSLLPNTLLACDEVGLKTTDIFAFDVKEVNINEEVDSWTCLFRYGEKAWVNVKNPAETVAHYASTSGTSGLPKLALLSHSYHVSQAQARVDKRKLPYTKRRLTSLPPFHVFATPILPSSIHQGIETFVMRRLDMKKFLAAVQVYQITETYLAPPVIVGMPQSPHCTKEVVQTLRQIWWGGASLKYTTQLALYGLLHKDAKIQPVWGMTEAGWICAGKWGEKHTDDSVGKPLEGYQIKIVDENDNDITNHHKYKQGNILVKGPALMLGYLDNPTATAETLDQATGWLRTGDIGYYRNGKVWVVDRSKDMIKVRGWQVSPAEVEAALLQHPFIQDAAVIGARLPPQIEEELPIAYVVKAADSSEAVNESAIKLFLEDHLATYKRPKQVLFVESIPKNPTGKILRRILREQFAESMVDGISSMDGLTDKMEKTSHKPSSSFELEEVTTLWSLKGLVKQVLGWALCRH